MSEDAERVNRFEPGKRLRDCMPDELRDPESRRQFLKDLATFTGLSGIFTWMAYTKAISLKEELSGNLDEEDPRWIFYEPQDPVDIMGSRLKLIGLSHTVQTFISYEDDVRGEVRRAPFVFAEYFGRELREHARPSLSNPQLKELASRNFFAYQGGFYIGLGKICAQEGKDIVVVNPQTNMSELVETYLMTGTPLGLIVTDVLKLVRRISGEPISRRSFLRLLGYGASTLTWASYLELTRKIRAELGKTGILSSGLSEWEQADILGWHLLDFRDLRTADGIEKTMVEFSSEVNGGQEPLFQGRRHGGVREYLNDKELRLAKMLFYQDHNLVSENTVRRYTWNSRTESWGLAMQIPY